MEGLTRYVATTKSGEKISYTSTKRLSDDELEELLARINVVLKEQNCTIDDQ